tara:strand:- start:434 stop:778 length:345 start_codon:yes stop_codon:yes gene_type:complete
MQKDIFKEDYFGTLMCILVDESRRILPTFTPTTEQHKIQSEMCKAGTWIDKVPIGSIIHTVPQKPYKKLEEDSLPKYRRLAADLIENFINTFKLQGGDTKQLQEKIGSMYIWKK